MGYAGLVVWVGVTVEGRWLGLGFHLSSLSLPRSLFRSSSDAAELPIRPWSCRRARGQNTGSEHQPGHPQVADPFEFRSLPIRSTSNAVELPIRQWSCRRARGPAWPCGAVAGRRIFGRKENDPVFLPTLTCLCFFLFHADLSACYWWAKRWWILPPPNRSYFLSILPKQSLIQSFTNYAPKLKKLIFDSL
jgi:hypothetical protein